MAAAGTPARTTCPKCNGKFTQHFSSISGNSKYITWKCESCGHAETKCTGILS